MIPFITGIVPRRLGISKRSHLRAVGTDLAAGLVQIAMLITLLTHQAWLITDAIARTLYRLLVSHRRLLEWVTATQAKLTTRLDLRGFYESMAGGVRLNCDFYSVPFPLHRADEPTLPVHPAAPIPPASRAIGRRSAFEPGLPREGLNQHCCDD
jgi:hypothetical protein